MKSTFKTMTALEIIVLATSKKLNPDPISQRPPTSSGFAKSIGIIRALKGGYGVGMITVRFIQDDVEMRKVYPFNSYLVIDGGHRVRSLVDYYQNRFAIDGKYFADLSDKEQEEFLSIEIPIESIVCTSVEAINIFRVRNETTDVNFIEMILCDDQSQICKEVRSRTKKYREYQNEVHPLFAIKYDSDGAAYPEHFKGDVNHRRKWDEYVFIAMLKAIGGGNVSAGEKEIQNLLDEEYQGNNKVSKRILNVIDRFFNDVLTFRKVRGSNQQTVLNSAIYRSLQLVWFGLYEKNKEFTIKDETQFHKSFMKAYGSLIGKSCKKYDNKIVDIGTEETPKLVSLKEYIRTNIKNYANSEAQNFCAEWFLKEMGENNGVLFRDEKRSLSMAEREEQLALQNFKCAIDGKYLKLEDSVWAHDVAWSEGGNTYKGAVVRKGYNSKMGTLTINQFKNVMNEEYSV